MHREEWGIKFFFRDSSLVPSHVFQKSPFSHLATYILRRSSERIRDSFSSLCLSLPVGDTRISLATYIL